MKACLAKGFCKVPSGFAQALLAKGFCELPMAFMKAPRGFAKALLLKAPRGIVKAVLVIASLVKHPHICRKKDQNVHMCVCMWQARGFTRAFLKPVSSKSPSSESPSSKGLSQKTI